MATQYLQPKGQTFGVSLERIVLREWLCATKLQTSKNDNNTVLKLNGLEWSPTPSREAQFFYGSSNRGMDKSTHILWETSKQALLSSIKFISFVACTF